MDEKPLLGSSARFWIGLAAFQVVFGLSVFLVTRHVYMPADDLPALDAMRTSTGLDLLRELESEIDAVAKVPAGPADTDLQTPDAIAERADQRFQARQYAEAAALYERLVALDASNVDLLNNLAITLHYVGRSEEALRKLDEGLAIDASHQRAWLTRGFIQSQLGNTDAAQAALSSALRIDPNSDVGQSAAQMLTDLGLEPLPEQGEQAQL